MTECEKMVKFVEDNYPLHYMIWEQQFFIDDDEDIIDVE
jgi:hypothetical protein